MLLVDQPLQDFSKFTCLIVILNCSFWSDYSKIVILMKFNATAYLSDIFVIVFFLPVTFIPFE